jgi:hypothetical protein
VGALARALWCVHRALFELSSRQAIARPGRHVPAVGCGRRGDSAPRGGHAHCDQGAAPFVLLVARRLFVRMCARACVCGAPVVRSACSRIRFYPSNVSIISCSRAWLRGALRDLRLENALPLLVGRCKSCGGAQRVADQASRLCVARFCAPRALCFACQARRQFGRIERCRFVAFTCACAARACHRSGSGNDGRSITHRRVRWSDVSRDRLLGEDVFVGAVNFTATKIGHLSGRKARSAFHAQRRFGIRRRGVLRAICCFLCARGAHQCAFECGYRRTHPASPPPTLLPVASRR